MQRKTLADDDYQVATTEGLLGAALTGRKRYQEAESLLLPAYRIIGAQFGDAHPRTQAMIRRLATLYSAWGRKAQADAFTSKLRN